MNTTDVTVVRIYLSEGHAHLDALLQRLRDGQVRGVTVFRGIAGFGDSGQLHTARLVDLSLSLPLVVEFFDGPERVAAVLEQVRPLVKPGHMLTWSARIDE